MDEVLSKADELAKQIATLEGGAEDNSDLKGILEQLRSAVEKRKSACGGAASDSPNDKDMEETSFPVSETTNMTTGTSKNSTLKELSELPLVEIIKIDAFMDEDEENLESDGHGGIDDSDADSDYMEEADNDFDDIDEKKSQKVFTKIKKSPKSGGQNSKFSDSCKICEILDKASSDNAEGDGTVVGDVSINSSQKPKIFTSLLSFVAHVKEKHVVMERTDIEPPLASTSSESRSEHVVRVPHLKCYLPCPNCDKKYSLHSTTKSCYDQLVFHLYRKHGEAALPGTVSYYSCEQCSFQTLRRRDLVRHNAVIHGDSDVRSRGIPCDKCGKFILKSSLLIHMAAVHGVDDVPDKVKERTAKVTCDICNKEFRGLIGLERHKKCIHGRVKDHLCHLCSSSFFAKRDLQLHMFATHKINISNMKVLKCPVEGCTYETLARRHLDVHSAVHKDTKDYACEFCGKTFKSMPAIRQHLRIMHTTDQEYKCPKCCFKSHAKQYVKRHMVIHSDTKAHKCQFEGCTYETHFIENLNKHKRKHMKNKK